MLIVLCHLCSVRPKYDDDWETTASNVVELKVNQSVQIVETVKNAVPNTIDTVNDTADETAKTKRKRVRKRKNKTTDEAKSGQSTEIETNNRSSTGSATLKSFDCVSGGNKHIR